MSPARTFGNLVSLNSGQNVLSILFDTCLASPTQVKLFLADRLRNHTWWTFWTEFLCQIWSQSIYFRAVAQAKLAGSAFATGQVPTSIWNRSPDCHRREKMSLRLFVILVSLNSPLQCGIIGSRGAEQILISYCNICCIQEWSNSINPFQFSTWNTNKQLQG